ncbi:MAG: response regulator transcription factor [Candidatus Avigastranaerophilus sp.]
MENNSNSFDDDDIVLSVKKSDIKRFFDGKPNISVKVYSKTLSNFVTNAVSENKTNEKNNGKLTARQLEVLQCMAKGQNNLKIAAELCVSRHTIKAHVANILHKLKVEDRYQAVIKAINEKIV